ncbi:MAG: dihydrofolate reductase [Flavobacteriales bacterium]|nr:dihydrofolate reductase [Flavobacteriales bacterium]
MLSIIVAADRNNVIGKDNALIWHLPNDLRFFRTKTTGHTVIMGRRTFDSVGKPLPGRRNIIVSRNAHFKADGCETVTSLEAALAICNPGDENFIVGGEEIYRQALPLADRVYLTRIDHEFEGDRHFPQLGAEWELTKQTQGIVDERNIYPHTFLTYSRATH